MPTTDEGAAHPPSHETSPKGQTAEEPHEVPEEGRKVNIDFHGFVETIARADLTARTFDFSIQQAEIDMIGDWHDVVFFRADLQYDAYYFDDSSPEGFVTSFVEQAIADVQFYEKAHLKVGLGRFNAPMGFEALDPLDRPIASYSQVFNYMDPFLFVGLRFSGQYEWFDFVAYVTQGYEVIVDNNTDKTVGGRLGFRPNEKGYIGLAATYGSEYADNASPRTNVSLDFTITPNDKALIGGELTFRHEVDDSTVEPGADGYALGGILEGSYRFHDFFGLAARGDFIQDFSGIIWGRPLGTYTWTVAPTVHLYDHARIQLEYKGWAATEPNFSTESPTPESPTASQLFQTGNIFNGLGEASSTSHTLTLQMIGNF